MLQTQAPLLGQPLASTLNIARLKLQQQLLIPLMRMFLGSQESTITEILISQLEAESHHHSQPNLPPGATLMDSSTEKLMMRHTQESTSSSLYDED